MIQAITLSGGGAYGAFEVGVLKALMGGHAPVTDGEPLDPQIYTVPAGEANKSSMSDDSTPAFLADAMLRR